MSMPAGCERSQVTTPSTDAPCATIRSRVAESALSLRPAIDRSAPSAASASAVLRPMPAVQHLQIALRTLVAELGRLAEQSFGFSQISPHPKTVHVHQAEIVAGPRV